LPIRLLVLDIDGVITDGTVSLYKGPLQGKRISFHDLDAVTRARREGVEVLFLTGEDTPAVDAIARRFGVTETIRAAKDKGGALKRISRKKKIPLGEIAYVGDGDRDAAALEAAGLGLAPANATRKAKTAAHCVLGRSGGKGAVAEVVELIRRINGDHHAGARLQKGLEKLIKDSLRCHERFLKQSPPILALIARRLIQTIRTGRKILLFGNGGSAADAQHVAGEIVGKFAKESDPWPAIALTTDTSILTSVGNDWDFSEIFARQVRALARPGDVVVGISTSGRSPNVLKGLEAGRRLDALTIGFAGAKAPRMEALCDLCFCAPSAITPRIQELHILAWHSVCEIVERELMDSGGE